jgi:hypothetical protein
MILAIVSLMVHTFSLYRRIYDEIDLIMSMRASHKNDPKNVKAKKGNSSKVVTSHQICVA